MSVDNIVQLHALQNGGYPELEPDLEVETTLGEVPKYPTEALPRAAQKLVEGCERNAVPAALVGGAAVVALAAAIGGKAQIEVGGAWTERAILWVPGLAVAGAGKSPAQQIVFAPLREINAEAEEDERFLTGDQTLEALVREMDAVGGAVCIELDELAVLLRGLGEYKRQGGGDRRRFLQLWTGAPISFNRVGGGKGKNATRILIPRPTISIFGGLQPQLHSLLGPDEDGMRHRWLPHLAEAIDSNDNPLVMVETEAWSLLVGLLHGKRSAERSWKMSLPASDLFDTCRRDWRRQSRQAEATACLQGALLKAPGHLMRLALVLAEAEHPDGRAAVPIAARVLERAKMIVDFALDCWRALPQSGSMGLSVRDGKLDEGVDKLVEWLERQEGRKSTVRLVGRARVAGCRTKDDLAALIKRYDDTYPGHITTETSSNGGSASRVIRAPDRRKPGSG